jgi:hypothetical protein
LAAAGDALGSELRRRWPDAVLADYPALPTGADTQVIIPEWWRPGL